MVERYNPPTGIVLTILLPCSARKPYSKSKSHISFRDHICRGAKENYSFVHEVIVTSPLGLVPRELEDIYPAGHYDVPVTGVWSEEEIEIVLRLIEDYQRKTDGALIGYGEGAYQDIFERAGIVAVTGDLDKLERLVSKKLKELEREKITPRTPERLKKVRAVCNFQFGHGAWQHLFGDSPLIKGFQITVDGVGLVATVDRNSGYISLSLEGAKRLYHYGRYTAELSFEPETSSIFSIGVEKSDHDIRPKDEVIAIYRDEVVGVGKAALSGAEMERAKKGLAISLRHRRK
jgi:archaeosine synthase